MNSSVALWALVRCSLGWALRHLPEVAINSVSPSAKNNRHYLRYMLARYFVADANFECKQIQPI